MAKLSENNYTKTRTRIATMTGSIKKITLSTKSEAPEYQIMFTVKQLTDEHMIELLAMHKVNGVKITISYEEPQPTLNFDEEHLNSIESITFDTH